MTSNDSAAPAPLKLLPTHLDAEVPAHVLEEHRAVFTQLANHGWRPEESRGNGGAVLFSSDATPLYLMFMVAPKRFFIMPPTQISLAELFEDAANVSPACPDALTVSFSDCDLGEVLSPALDDPITALRWARYLELFIDRVATGMMFSVSQFATDEGVKYPMHDLLDAFRGVVKTEHKRRAEGEHKRGQRN
jgi:hypothetical protein